LTAARKSPLRLLLGAGGFFCLPEFFTASRKSPESPPAIFAAAAFSAARLSPAAPAYLRRAACSSADKHSQPALPHFLPAGLLFL